MKNYKNLFLTLALAGALLTACSNQDAAPKEDAAGNKTETTESSDSTKEVAEEIKGVSKDNNIVVDKENQTVTIYANFNGKFLTESTRHLVVSETGKFADKPVFKSYTAPADLHQALLDIGAEPGNNMTPENAEETTSEGTPLDVTLYWEGNEDGVDVNDFIVDPNGKGVDLRFTGNLDRANDKKTGCLSCLDSCTVGITSNANYPYGSVEKAKTVEFGLNEELAPEDGTPIAIVYSIKG